MTDNEYAIEVRDLRKKFCRSLKRSLLYGTTDVVRAMAGFPVRNPEIRKGEFWALDGISFQLKRGESLGLIGANGCGKSTLLRMLTGIFPPDRGEITIRGRMASLIAVGAGFHPHMSGAENIYLNGVLLGLTRREIRKRFDEIVEFAEIGPFIEAPVSTYSSGMRVRLGFGIAVHTDPEILLVDEVMSVGDTRFRRKASLAMTNLLRRSNTALVFVSHNAYAVRQQCNRAIVMDHGKMLFEGDVDEAYSLYHEMGRDESSDQVTFTGDFESFRIIGEQDDNTITADREFTIEIGLSEQVVLTAEMPITITIFDEDSSPLVALQPPSIVIKPQRLLRFSVGGLPLKNGDYTVQCKLGSTTIQGASTLQGHPLKVTGNPRHSNTPVCIDLEPIDACGVIRETG